jgi:hypothetical protein
VVRHNDTGVGVTTSRPKFFLGLGARVGRVRA